MEYRLQEFSKLGQISIRTLGHLKMAGILVPARTDVMGKEYYTDSQLVGLRKITIMSELGMSPSEIGRALNSSDNGAAFEARRKKNHDEVDEARNRLKTFDHLAAESF